MLVNVILYKNYINSIHNKYFVPKKKVNSIFHLYEITCTLI